MGACCGSLGVLWGFDGGVLLGSLKAFYGFYEGSIGSMGILCAFYGFYGVLWGFYGFYGVLWGSD